MRRAQVAERRARIAKLYLGGKSQPQISRELGIAQSTVSENLNALIADWKRQAGVDIAALRAMDLERLRGVEEQAWDSFEESKQQKKVVSAAKKSDPEGETVTAALTKFDRNEGDPRFLLIVLRCIAQRAKLLGLDFREQSQGTKEAQPLTLEDFVVAHSKSNGQNGKGGAQMATKPSPLHLDPSRLP